MAGAGGAGVLPCSWLKSPVLVPGIMDQVEHTQTRSSGREAGKGQARPREFIDPSFFPSVTLGPSQ